MFLVFDHDARAKKAAEKVRKADSPAAEAASE
jgi:hypothetical protein